MCIFREEDREGPGRDHQPCLWTITVEADIAAGIEGPVRLLARGERPPADLLDAGKRQLDVDVLPVRFETRTVAAPSFDLIDREVDLVPIDVASAWRERLQVGRTQVVERARERWMQLPVLRGSADAVEDQLAHHRGGAQGAEERLELGCVTDGDDLQPVHGHVLPCGAMDVFRRNRHQLLRVSLPVIG